MDDTGKRPQDDDAVSKRPTPRIEAPRPNLELRHARREADRRRDRRVAWWGLLGVWAAALVEAFHHRHGTRDGWRPRWLDRPRRAEGKPARSASPGRRIRAPKPRDRATRDALRRAAWRRHAVQTAVVVTLGTAFYLLYLWVRITYQP